MKSNTNEIYKEKYKTVDIDNYEEIRKHINKKHSIYLYGKYGSGKTHFLMWLARTYNARGHHVYVKRSSDIHLELLDEIKYAQATGEIKGSVRINMRDAELLFIDDLGNEKMSDFLHECLESVIDYRYRNELPIFITSNYSLIELYEKWQPQIGDVKTGQLVSRIKTFGAIEIKGRNWRV